jgi:hypothetical protein
VQPHYPVWDGLSLESICLSAGSLILYRGLQDSGIRVAASSWAIVNRDPSGFIRPEDTWVLPPWRRGDTLKEVLSGRAREVNSTG